MSYITLEQGDSPIAGYPEAISASDEVAFDIVEARRSMLKHVKDATTLKQWQSAMGKHMETITGVNIWWTIDAWFVSEYLGDALQKKWRKQVLGCFPQGEADVCAGQELKRVRASLGSLSENLLKLRQEPIYKALGDVSQSDMTWVLGWIQNVSECKVTTAASMSGWSDFKKDVVTNTEMFVKKAVQAPASLPGVDARPPKKKSMVAWHTCGRTITRCLVHTLFLFLALGPHEEITQRT